MQHHDQLHHAARGADKQFAHRLVIKHLEINLGEDDCRRSLTLEAIDRIEQYISPELNPEERLNADLKHALYTKVPVRTKAKLKAAATEHMQVLEKSLERVKKFFQDVRVKYAE